MEGSREASILDGRRKVCSAQLSARVVAGTRQPLCHPRPQHTHRPHREFLCRLTCPHAARHPRDDTHGTSQYCTLSLTRFTAPTSSPTHTLHMACCLPAASLLHYPLRLSRHPSCCASAADLHLHLLCCPRRRGHGQVAPHVRALFRARQDHRRLLSIVIPPPAKHPPQRRASLRL